MGRSTNLDRAVRAERRAMIALVTVFALLIQALIPNLAAASPGPFDGQLICTQMGLGAASDQPGGAPQTGHACQHCVCPAPAAEPTPLVVAVAQVRYAATVAPRVQPRRTLSPPTRAPPRPPGQGPPTSNA